MKFLPILFVFLSFFTLGNAQTSIDKWPELKNFHEIIAKTFHPSQEGKMDPVKQKSTDLYAKAKLLTKHKIPDAFDNAEVRKAAKDLEDACKKVNDLVKKKASDDDIKKALSDAHDAFHHLLETAKVEE